MLFAINAGGGTRRITRVPHGEDYRRWRARLGERDFRLIWDALDARVEGDEILTSSWIPGADWTGTVFQPIYDRACGGDQESAAKFFGLILWDVVMSRPDQWAFGKYEKDGVPIAGTTYFRIGAQRR